LKRWTEAAISSKSLANGGHIVWQKPEKMLYVELGQEFG